MDVFEAIRINALRDVVKKDDGTAMRRVFRWYSRQFHTPLHVVEELPMEHVLQTYWEDYYEDLEEPEITKEIAELTKTDEQRRKEDREWDEQQAEMAELGKLVSKNLPNKISQLNPEPSKALVPDLEAPKTIPVAEEKVLLSEIKELPPDVHMKFEIPEDLDIDSIPVPEKPLK